MQKLFFIKKNSKENVAEIICLPILFLHTENINQVQQCNSLIEEYAKQDNTVVPSVG